ncbi:MAG: hypothetical protein K2F81_05910 [Ruminococcus sp.]|nr:hypothetical protein [Ruminococcus sp.]
MEVENLHDGHRARMRSKFAKNMNFSNFEEHEILEMLLFYCYPRGNTNQTAHRLINRFGSLSSVLSASYEELVESKIIGENPALSLKFFYALNIYLHVDKTTDEIDIRDIPRLKDFIGDLFYGISYEQFKLFFTDNSYILKNHMDIQTGSSQAVEISLRNVTKAILNSGANYFFIAHNHPNSSSLPSDEDILLTKKIITHLRSMDIHLLDHFIAGNDGITSMRQLGLIYDFEK